MFGRNDETFKYCPCDSCTDKRRRVAREERERLARERLEDAQKQLAFLFSLEPASHSQWEENIRSDTDPRRDDVHHT